MAGELGFDTGPYVNVACFCDLAIQGNDNVISVIRVIDQLTVQAVGPDVPDDLPPGHVVGTTLVIVLKPGEARGRATVQIVLEHPNPIEKTELPELSVQFNGGPNNGVNMVLPFRFQPSSTGLYWAHVLVNGRVVTRVPLQINYGFMRGPAIPPGL